MLELADKYDCYILFEKGAPGGVLKKDLITLRAQDGKALELRSGNYVSFPLQLEREEFDFRGFLTRCGTVRNVKLAVGCLTEEFCIPLIAPQSYFLPEEYTRDSIRGWVGFGEMALDVNGNIGGA
jgi:hypothetical protein